MTDTTDTTENKDAPLIWLKVYQEKNFGGIGGVSHIGVPTTLLRSSNKNPRKSAFAQHPRHPRSISP